MDIINRFLCLFLSLECLFVAQCLANDRPIIGIFAEENPEYNKFGKYGNSNLVATYVKFLETGGARVVPIMIYQSREYYEDLLSKINGVLFTGGGYFFKTKGYGRTGKIIFDIAVKLNKKKDYFPLWGTCLGFEFLNYVVAKKLWMKECAAEDLALPINLVQGFGNSRMLYNIDTELSKTMQTRNVTIHYHRWCLTQQNYTLSGLDKFYRILALNQDNRNLTFISMIEAFDYPFYGVAFHPEKVLLEFVLTKTHKNTPHSKESVKVSQYFANFFVNEARKNNHSFKNKTEESEALIYNYDPVYTGKSHSAQSQIYFFNASQDAMLKSAV